jgi:lipopolysaccharide/colanic/teichoic acid biosynthesis glycosyltransferase
MVTNAEQLGPGITPANDPRITPLGAWLRRSKVDELPQLINVLKGEMSLVGPRPEDPRYVACYTAEEHATLEVPPGITSLASLYYRSESERLTGPDWEKTYLAEVLPHKLQIELNYLRTRTIRTDLQVLVKTVLALASRDVSAMSDKAL